MLSFILLFFKFFIPVDQSFLITGEAQGTTYSITYQHPFQAVHKSEIDSLLLALDNEFSLYNNHSSIITFNKASRGIKSSTHISTLIRKSLQISASTQGAFDITIFPLAILWGKFNKTTISVPTAKSIQSALLVSGYKKITLTSDSLLKSNPFTKIDTDGIAQGYSVDVIANYLEKMAINDFLVEVGGEIKTKGYNKEGKLWRIGFPQSNNYSLNSKLDNQVLALTNLAVSTSARFSKFTTTQLGKKSHIIDPRTGLTLENGIISVTVIAQDGISADGYDNGFMVLGIDSSIALANSIKNIGIHIVYESEGGEIKDTSNNYFKNFIAH